MELPLKRTLSRTLNARTPLHLRDHQLRNIPLPELELQACVLEAVPASVLAGHDVVVGDGGPETRVKHCAEGIGLEGPAGQSVGLRSVMLPAGEGVALDELVHAVVDWDVVLSSGSDRFLDVGEGVVGAHAVSYLDIELAVWVEELVVGVDEEDSGVVGHCKGVWPG